MNPEEQERIRKEVAETFGHKTERAFNPLTQDDLSKMPEAQKYEKEFKEKEDVMKKAFEKLRKPAMKMPSLPSSVSGLNPAAKTYTPAKKGGMRKHTAKKHSNKHGGMRKHTAKKHSKKHSMKKHSKKQTKKHSMKKHSKKQTKKQTKKHHKRK